VANLSRGGQWLVGLGCGRLGNDYSRANFPLVSAYPKNFRDRNRWILHHRGVRNVVSGQKPDAVFRERELNVRGQLGEVATIFLTNRECPWKCFMCDLWQNTLEETLPAGQIPEQIRWAYRQLAVPATAADREGMQVKLYNSGSFFDPKAIPPADYPAIIDLVRGFESLVVECHPRLIGPRLREFSAQCSTPLEVAMGLETAHPATLNNLNKGFGLDDFQRAAERLRQTGVALRTFLLVNPPFLPRDEAREWTRRSVRFAWTVGSSVVSLIPTRQTTTFTKDALPTGDWRSTTLRQLEDALDDALVDAAGRVFVDTWDLEAFGRCGHCLTARSERLRRINETQEKRPRIECDFCHGD
jgi:archaeosine synthase beta-subunit